MNHVLIVDDDPDSAATLRELIGEEHFSVAVAHSLRDARRQMAMQQPHLVLLDLQLPDGSGMELFEDPRLESKVVLVTGHASLDSSIAALRHGALDYLVKPVALDRLEDLLARFLPRSPACHPAVSQPLDSPSPGGDQPFGRLLGGSQPMQRVYQQIRRVAATSVTVLITGESGTGKEVVAQTLHDLSPRQSQPFLAINCGAISPHLIESEIFGHEKGSFTGAERQHQGFFERAAGGTLFLDEITEMPLDLQVKLLRVLETGCFMRVGSTQSQETDVRIVAATNRCPRAAIATGKLREDLFYRLNVFPIELPPLRERLSDVPVLAQHFLDDLGAREGTVKRFAPEALQQLSEHQWPGNVRELRNAVQRAYVMAQGTLIDSAWLPHRAPASGERPAADGGSSDRIEVRDAPGVNDASGEEPAVAVAVGMSMAQAEKLLIQATLKQCMYQKERTAAVLGISLKTLYNRLKDYSSSPPVSEH